MKCSVKILILYAIRQETLLTFFFFRYIKLPGLTRKIWTKNQKAISYWQEVELDLCVIKHSF